MSDYQADHDPPLWWERVLKQPASAALGVLGPLLGALVALDPLFPTSFSKSLGELPLVLAATMGLFYTVGGLLILVGVLNNWHTRSDAWRMERAGWVFLSAAFAAYGVAVLAAYPHSVIAWLVSFDIAVLGFLRGLALWRNDRREKRKKLSRQTGGTQVVEP